MTGRRPISCTQSVALSSAHADEFGDHFQFQTGSDVDPDNHGASPPKLLHIFSSFNAEPFSVQQEARATSDPHKDWRDFRHVD